MRTRSKAAIKRATSGQVLTRSEPRVSVAAATNTIPRAMSEHSDADVSFSPTAGAPRYQNVLNWDVDTPRPEFSRMSPPTLSKMVDFAHSTPEATARILDTYRDRIDVNQLQGGAAELAAAEATAAEYRRQQERKSIEATLRIEREKWEAEQRSEMARLQEQMREQLSMKDRRVVEHERLASRARELAEQRAAEVERKCETALLEAQHQHERAARLASELEAKERSMRVLRSQLFTDNALSDRIDPPIVTSNLTPRVAPIANPTTPAVTPAAAIELAPPVVPKVKKQFKENPGECDGKDWDLYKFRFLACKEANKWDEEEAARALMAKLKGDALNIFRAQRHRSWTFAQLWEALDNRYETEVPTHIQGDMVSLLYQKPKQTLQQFMDEVAAAVFSKLDDPEEEERVALQQFRRGIADAKTKNHLAKHAHLYTNITSACTVATKYQARKQWDTKTPVNARIGQVTVTSDFDKVSSENHIRELQQQVADYKKQLFPNAGGDGSSRGGRGGRRNRRQSNQSQQGQHWHDSNGQPPPPAQQQQMMPPSNWQQHQMGPSVQQPQQYASMQAPQQPPSNAAYVAAAAPMMQSNSSMPQMSVVTGNAANSVPSMQFTPSNVTASTPGQPGST